jgi:hypothetical protein
METLQRTANRGSISTGFDIDNSLKFERGNTEWMGQVITTTTNRKTFTFSAWVKRTDLDATDNFGHVIWTGGVAGSNIPVYLRFDGNASYKDKIRLDIGYNGSTFFTLRTDAVYRDTSAWYHIVLAVDTSQATDTNRVKLYVNGTQATLSGSYPTLNFDTQNNYTQSSSSVWALGAYYGGSYAKANMYLAEVHHIDGSQLSPTDFGEFDEDTGIWKPIEYTGTYGTNGFYLDFEDSGSLGADDSGNGNNFTLTNITSVDQATDTPTNNFCTWNPLQTGWNTNYGTGQVITEGATEAYASTNYAAIEGSMAVQSGKWYWESKPNRTGAIMVGVAALNGTRWAGDTAYWYLGMNAQGIGTLLGNWYYNGTSTSTDATDWTNGDIVSIALDMDNYKIYMAVNGSWAGTSNPATGSGGYDFSSASNFTSNFVVPAGRIETANSSYVIETNFGGYTTMSIASGNSDANGYGNFEYAPPSGYYALCSKNLAEFG